MTRPGRLGRLLLEELEGSPFPVSTSSLAVSIGEPKRNTREALYRLWERGLVDKTAWAESTWALRGRHPLSKPRPRPNLKVVP